MCTILDKMVKKLSKVCDPLEVHNLVISVGDIAYEPKKTTFKIVFCIFFVFLN